MNRHRSYTIMLIPLGSASEQAPFCSRYLFDSPGDTQGLYSSLGPALEKPYCVFMRGRVLATDLAGVK